MKTDFSKLVVQYLREGDKIVLSTICPDGSLHAVPVWYSYEDETQNGTKNGSVYVLTGRNSQKVKNISHNPNIALEIDYRTAEWDVKGAIVKGKARILDEKETEVVEKQIGTKYPWYYQYPWKKGERIGIKIDLDSYRTWNVKGALDAFELEGGRYQLLALIGSTLLDFYGPTFSALSKSKKGLTPDEVSEITKRDVKTERSYLSRLARIRLITKVKKENRFRLSEDNTDVLRFLFEEEIEKIL